MLRADVAAGREAGLQGRCSLENGRGPPKARCSFDAGKAVPKADAALRKVEPRGRKRGCPVQMRPRGEKGAPRGRCWPAAGGEGRGGRILAQRWRL